VIALALVVSPSFLVMAGALLVLGALSVTSVWTPFSPSLLALVPIGAVLGVLSAGWMHNAAHGNFRPRWLNPLVGELCGLQQLLGFRGWTLFHQMHHRDPDDPVLDPHPPAGHTYWGFVDQMKNLIQRCAARRFFQAHGDSPETRRIWRATVAFLFGGRFMRSVFVFNLLGPKLFVWLFGPSLLVNLLIYCHFNYATHRPRPDGTVEIINLDKGAGYRLLNFLTSGAYFHRNHHLRPGLFDPRRQSIG
jgi:stearoyl-CoA desaturase (delta-9 desaturase)